MSESNGAPDPRPLYQLPDELFVFHLTNGESHSFDIIECNLEQNQIAKESESHPDDPVWHLHEFRRWLESQTKARGLRLAQVDTLWCKCREEFTLRKKSQSERLKALQSSPTSSDSAPTDNEA